MLHQHQHGIMTSVQVADDPIQGIDGMTSPCYTFMMRFRQCQRKEEAWIKMCREEKEDVNECFTKQKQMAFSSFLNTETRKQRIYSLPTYDYKTDTWKDGPLPKDADGYFKKSIGEQTYYD